MLPHIVRKSSWHDFCRSGSQMDQAPYHLLRQQFHSHGTFRCSTSFHNRLGAVDTLRLRRRGHTFAAFIDTALRSHLSSSLQCRCLCGTLYQVSVGGTVSQPGSTLALRKEGSLPACRQFGHHSSCFHSQRPPRQF